MDETKLAEDIKAEVFSLAPQFKSDFSDGAVNMAIKMAIRESCCSCDTYITALLSIHFLLGFVANLDHTKQEKFKQYFNHGYNVTSESIGYKSVSYATPVQDENSDYKTTTFGEHYANACRKKKNSFLGIGVIS